MQLGEFFRGLKLFYFPLEKRKRTSKQRLYIQETKMFLVYVQMFHKYVSKKLPPARYGPSRRFCKHPREYGTIL